MITSEIRRCWISASISESWRAPAAAVIALVLVACGHGAADVRKRALATANDVAITVGEFERSYALALMQTGANDTEKARRAHLDRLIGDQLLYDEAVRQGMHQDSVTAVFEKRAGKKALGGRFYEEALLKTLPPLTEGEVRRAFLRHKQPVIARHLLYASEQEARAAHARLEAGRPFLEEAQDCFGTARFDSTAGHLGLIRYFQVDDAVAEASFDLDVGAFSQPVRGRQGYHIIRVEDRIRSPILTESEYQAHKAGIASLLRLRRRRLRGDRFVRSFMEQLGVVVNPEGIRALGFALRRLEHRVEPAPVDLAGEDQAVPMALAPDSPLATYHQGGRQLVFTVADYLFWLPELPFREATQRTAASVGRALRNEAFSRAGDLAGLSGSQLVKADMESEIRSFTAAHLRARGLDSALAADALRRPQSVSVDSALFRQIMDL